MSEGDDAAHLDEPVRRELLLSDDQRIARIDRDRWIGYCRALDVLHELERILHSERRQRPDNLLIVGASNNGKTAIARRFIARVLPPENVGATASRIPVALIQAPNGPRIPQLLMAIRAALGHPPGRREATAQLRSETYAMMRRVGLRLLLIELTHPSRHGLRHAKWAFGLLRNTPARLCCHEIGDGGRQPLVRRVNLQQ